MAYEDFAELLGGWEGFELVDIKKKPASENQPVPQLILELRALPEYPKRCSRCGEIVVEIHDVTERQVRDLPVFDWDTWIVFPSARLQCPRCGPTVEMVPWLDRYQRVTKRLAEAIGRMAMVFPIKHVAAWFRVGWDTVKEIDKRALFKRLEPVDLSGLRVIAVDEFALHRGHRYATMVAEPATKRVLWVKAGRERESIASFFRALGVAGCEKIEAVVMDMWRPYREEVTVHCPNAVIVYDLFHIVAKYGLEVIDPVRVDETNKVARARGANDSITRAVRRVIKGTRWLLLRNPENLTSSADRVRLKELLKANRALFVVYVLKADLKQLWRFRYTKADRRFWTEWYRRAMASRIKPLKAFARMLADRIEGVIAHCQYPLHTSLLEGINNKIKVMKRMAYGYRDEEYFFLKIRAAFPGITG